ncbi:hypothetical protein ACFL0L_02240 [Patescibacteria group bacterium]
MIIVFAIVFLGYVLYNQLIDDNDNSGSNENMNGTALLCITASDCELSYEGECAPCTLEYYECVTPEEAERRDDERELIPPEERPACAPCLEETIENFICICINAECVKRTR